jgi:hypothetical protein
VEESESDEESLSELSELLLESLLLSEDDESEEDSDDDDEDDEEEEEEEESDEDDEEDLGEAIFAFLAAGASLSDSELEELSLLLLGEAALRFKVFFGVFLAGLFFELLSSSASLSDEESLDESPEESELSDASEASSISTSSDVCSGFCSLAQALYISRRLPVVALASSLRSEVRADAALERLFCFRKSATRSRRADGAVCLDSALVVFFVEPIFESSV